MIIVQYQDSQVYSCAIRTAVLQAVTFIQGISHGLTEL